MPLKLAGPDSPKCGRCGRQPEPGTHYQGPDLEGHGSTRCWPCVVIEEAVRREAEELAQPEPEPEPGKLF